ncbi:MAG: hypothetical protein VYA84_02220 [Planctomycetota bacterium]|nr:hypothetical protein [Planctomycetota bacterium]
MHHGITRLLQFSLDWPAGRHIDCGDLTWNQVCGSSPTVFLEQVSFDQDAFHQRGKALEDEFFLQLDQKLLADLKVADNRENLKQQLPSVTSFQDDQWLVDLIDGGFQPTTLAAWHWCLRFSRLGRQFGDAVGATGSHERGVTSRNRRTVARVAVT